MKQTIASIALLFIGGTFIGGTIVGMTIIKYVDGAITKHEQVECQRWQQQAIDYSQAGYYLTDWQIAQCEAVDFPIKVAPAVPRKDFK